MHTKATIAEPIRIIEYSRPYAKAVADMWNRSTESWGGGNSTKTEEDVLRDMENSTNLHVFLAVDGDEVVGFCSFSHYKPDEGALYVPLLNVRPDYHGHKVGRNLILNAVRKTVELGWPRLDLFTWAGNTKAVPMYKKCGFFWEKKDDSVHLLNFIPTVLQTEALASYFQILDWYEDGTRELVIEPDGRRERNFDFFEYTWQKNDLSLRAEFEKTGRGLTGLSTPDYEIKTLIDDHDLVFGAAYPIRYEIVNRSSAPLSIEIKGRDDKNIRFASEFQTTIAPGATEVLEGKFQLDPIEEEQNDWKTHPTVMSEWKINGLRAEFRIGIAPKFPAKVSMVLPSLELVPGVSGRLYLNVENNFATEAEFAFELPADDALEWENPNVRLSVAGKSKASVGVAFRLKNPTLYSYVVAIHAKPSDGEAFTFTRHLHVLLKGTTGQYGGDSGVHWTAVNGSVALHLTKQNNNLWLDHPHSQNDISWMAPTLGKPFSAEFSKKKAEEVKILPRTDGTVMEILYESEDFPGYQIKSVARLMANGLTEHYYEVCNTNEEASEEDLILLTNLGFFGNHLILPYNGRFVDFEDGYAGQSDMWDTSHLTENWMFCKNDFVSYGFTWDASQTLLRTEWYFGIETRFGKIEPKTSVRTPSTFAALGTFTSWWDFRSFAVKRRDPVIPLLENHLELIVNGGNPFVKGDLQAELRDHKKVELIGTCSLELEEVGNERRQLTSVSWTKDETLHSGSLTVSSDSWKDAAGEYQKLHTTYRGVDWVQERRAVVFPTTEEAVSTATLESDIGETFTLSNGVLSIAATPAFGNVIHSLKERGEEWLDTSFPKPAPKSWWNPWLGGLGLEIGGMNAFSLQEEPRSAAFAKLSDSFGNIWTGLRLTTRIEKQEANRGITVNQYHLMLPGAPVLCTVMSVTNETGLYHAGFGFNMRNFFLPSPVFDEAWVELPGHNRFEIGQVESELGLEGLARFGAKHRESMLHVVHAHPHQHGWVYMNNKLINQGLIHRLELADGETRWTKPSFVITGKKKLDAADAQALLNLNFKLI
ncbi:GNAT family N-acetyltransferase [Gorillibacterium sp. CAU 1737]|uniref:GNAT family N-acetyltransferase n=1 Tax=Gorillibacterium sp. CAU 1737 TaxID=3140362 RepID=UPI0032600C1F